VVDWQASSGPTTIEWIFTPLPDGTTFVTITNSGFSGEGDERVKQALDSTEGFTFVLAGAKAWLEHGVQLNLVPDRFPQSMS
jgi:uncharacterized protein YndB with AHSA1/START domain